MSLNQFKAALPSLIARGFPKTDPDSGNIDRRFKSEVQQGSIDGMAE